MNINQSHIADIVAIIVQSKDKAICAVDHQRTLMYWEIGRRIFEEEKETIATNNAMPLHYFFPNFAK